MTARVRRFLLLLLVVAGWVAFVVWTPKHIAKPIVLTLCSAMLLWTLWLLAALPWPWARPEATGREVGHRDDANAC